jgi:hypothetical protein
MNNLRMIRTRLDNRERRVRGHGLIGTGPGARTGIFGSEGPPPRRSPCRAAPGPRSLALPVVRVGLPPDYS